VWFTGRGGSEITQGGKVGGGNRWSDERQYLGYLGKIAGRGDGSIELGGTGFVSLRTVQVERGGRGNSASRDLIRALRSWEGSKDSSNTGEEGVDKKTGPQFRGSTLKMLANLFCCAVPEGEGKGGNALGGRKEGESESLFVFGAVEKRGLY